MGFGTVLCFVCVCFFANSGGLFCYLRVLRCSAGLPEVLLSLSSPFTDINCVLLVLFTPTADNDDDDDDDEKDTKCIRSIFPGPRE